MEIAWERAGHLAANDGQRPTLTSATTVRVVLAGCLPLYRGEL
jgi:hypothetical protein